MSPRPERQRPGAQSGLVRRPEPIRTTADDPVEAPAVTAPDPRPAAQPDHLRAAPPRAAALARAGDDGDIDAEMLGRWRWQLGATARRAVAARARADSAMAAWERLVADAARAGVPGRLVVAAAADAGIDAPA